METKDKKSIMVTWDFTDKAEFALEHAIQLSKLLSTDVALVHIVKKDNDIDEATKKLNDVIEETRKKFQVKPMALVKVGNIFTTITELANEQNAEMVIMGTHGMKGMQKLTGSWALKVIVKSKVPFIVVQDPPADQERYHNIVFPVDFRNENKEKIKMAIFMGKYFDSKIRFLVTKTSDKNLLKKTNVNINFAIKYLMQNNIEYEIHEVTRGNFAQQTIDFAQKINADLILIVTTKNITVADYVLGASEQYIIANSSKIPVCCVNPKATFAKMGQFMGGWGD